MWLRSPVGVAVSAPARCGLTGTVLMRLSSLLLPEANLVRSSGSFNHLRIAYERLPLFQEACDGG